MGSNGHVVPCFGPERVEYEFNDLAEAIEGLLKVCSGNSFLGIESFFLSQTRLFTFSRKNLPFMAATASLGKLIIEA